jgi:hypothetical protein
MVGDIDLSYGLGTGSGDIIEFTCPATAPSGAPPRRTKSQTTQQTTRNFDLMDTLYANANDQFVNLPILAVSTGRTAAYQIFLETSDEIEVLAITHPNKRMRIMYNIVGNKVNLNWLTPFEGIEIKKGDVMANLVIKVNRKKSVKNISNLVKYVDGSQIVGFRVGDAGIETVPNFKVALPNIVIDNDMPITILDSIIGHPEEETVTDTTKSVTETITTPSEDIQVSKIINVIPNPMISEADITYSIAEESVVTMKLLNLLGVEIATLVNGEHQEVGVFRKKILADGIPNGVYVLRLETVSKSKKNISIEKIVVSR